MKYILLISHRIAFIGFIIIFYSCSEKFTNKYSILDESLKSLSDFKTKESLVPIAPPYSNRYSQKQLISDTLLYASNPRQIPNTIDVINLSNSKESYQIKIDRNLAKGDFYSFFVHSKDSIFLSLPTENLLVLVNGSGQPLDHFDLNLPKLADHSLMSFISSKPQVHGNEIIMSLRPVGLLEDGAYFKLDQFVSYNMETRVVKTFGEAQFLVEYLGGGEVNTDYYSPYYIINDSNELIVNYPFYPYLLVYDLDTLDLKKEIKISSGVVTSMNQPASSSIHYDGFANAAYRSESAAFSDLNYHSATNEYSILLMHPFESLDAQGKLKSWATRSSSLIIFDEDFYLKKELLFKNGNLLLNSVLGLNNGIQYATEEDSDNEDIMSYSHLINFNEL